MKKGKLITIILLLFLVGQVFAADCGDVNSDGIITIIDALMIAQKSVGLNPQPFDASAADVNGDNRITILDALQVAQFYVGIINELSGCINNEPGELKCMFIGADPDGATGAIRENAGYDKHIIPVLEEMGYIIDRKHLCSEVKNYTAADFEPYDFIFLSESIHSSQITEPLRSIYKPMLCAEAMGTRHTKLGFASSDDNTAGLYHPGDTAQILDSVGDHKLAAGYAPGSDVDFGDFSSNDSCLMTWGAPTIDVIPIAAMKDNMQHLVVYGVEKGTVNSHGEVINNRVSVVGTHAWCYRAEYIGEPMKNFIKAGIEWILE